MDTVIQNKYNRIRDRLPLELMNMESKRVLITGAGGFIGSHLVDRCKSLGACVLGVDRKPIEEWSRGERFCDHEIVADVSGAVLSQGNLGITDYCFHLAAESRIQPSFRIPLRYVFSNVVGTARALEYCRKVGAKLIYAGSSTADGDIRMNPYAATKLQGETLCKTWGYSFNQQTSIARFYNVYGPRQVEEGMWATVVGIFERQYRNGEPLTVSGDGKQRRDFTHVDDIVAGLVRIAEYGMGTGEIYPLGSGENHSILQVAQMFTTDSGRIQFYPRPAGEVEYTLCDFDLTLRHTGWIPTKRLEDYVAGVKKSVPVG